MIGKRASEAAIRVGADGAEWLVWQMRGETLVSGRMTASYSVEAALDQWLGRAARFGLKPRRVWLIAGAASCAHRRLRLPGTDPNIIEQALPLALEEELPLPVEEMLWTSRTHESEEGDSTIVDVVATPKKLFSQWEEALRNRKIEVVGKIPEGPLLWQELAAIRGSEIDLLTVWGERRATLIRGTEKGMHSLWAFVRGPGEPWEALLPDLKRPFEKIEQGKTVLAVFTSERLRKRILSLPDLIPQATENLLNRDIFFGVPEEVSVAVSLLVLRRIRIEKREPSILFQDVETGRPAADLRKVAKTLQVPYQVVGTAVLVVFWLAVWWGTYKVNSQHAKELYRTVDLMRAQQSILTNQIKALQNVKKIRVDWGSVWLRLSQTIPKPTLFEDFSYGSGGSIRINGKTEGLGNLSALETVLRETGFLKNVRIQKTETSDKEKISFQILAEFAPKGKIKRYTVTDPYFVPERKRTGPDGGNEKKEGAAADSGSVSKNEKGVSPDGKTGSGKKKTKGKK